MVEKPPPNANRDVSPEFNIFLDQICQRLPSFGVLAATIKPTEYGSKEWLFNVGLYHWEGREQSGLTRSEVAERMGVELNSIRFFEFGLGHIELGLTDLKGRIRWSGPSRSEFPRNFANALGRPEMYDEFRQRFIPVEKLRGDRINLLRSLRNKLFR